MYTPATTTNDKKQLSSAAFPQQATTPAPGFYLEDQRAAVQKQKRAEPVIRSSGFLQNNRPQAVVQQKQVNALAGAKAGTTVVQAQANTTGLPDGLKSGIEQLSGHSMDDVKVHYNSSQPAQLHAHAYAQGTHIHIAPGQQKHLPHEAWHVVQQKQGRVQPTMQLKSMVNVNDDKGLEKEADVMGAMALSTQGDTGTYNGQVHQAKSFSASVVQRRIENEDNIRELEKLMAAAGIPAHTGDYIKILHHAITLHDDNEMAEAKQYIWDTSIRYRQLEHSEVNFTPKDHPKRSLQETMGQSADQSAKGLYGIYRSKFDAVPDSEKIGAGSYFDSLNKAAGNHGTHLRFAPQGKEHESFRGHYQNAVTNGHPQQANSKNILEGAAAIRILRRVPSKNGATLSRLTLTIRPKSLEAAANGLAAIATGMDVVINLKIMGVANLGNGPDDVVIYLNHPISSEEVHQLVAAIRNADSQVAAQTGQPFLRNASPPVGMQLLSTGISGADMPSDEKIKKEGQGSHGSNMALIMSSAASSKMDESGASSFDSSFSKAGLQGQNPAYSSTQFFFNQTSFRLGQATGVSMNCFIDTILQATGADRQLVDTIARNLEQAGIRNRGEMIETHSEVMNVVVAEIERLTGLALTVRIVYQDPHTGGLNSMDVGSGGTVVHILYSQAHYTPMFRN